MVLSELGTTGQMYARMNWQLTVKFWTKYRNRKIFTVPASKPRYESICNYLRCYALRSGGYDGRSASARNAKQGFYQQYVDIFPSTTKFGMVLCCNKELTVEVRNDI